MKECVQQIMDLPICSVGISDCGGANVTPGEV